MARMNPRRRLLAKQAQTLHQALEARHSEQSAEFKPADAHIRSALSKPHVGYQGTYRAPRHVSEDNLGHGWYVAKNGKAKAQRPAVRPVKLVTLPVPLDPAHHGTLGRTIPFEDVEED